MGRFATPQPPIPNNITRAASGKATRVLVEHSTFTTTIAIFDYGIIAALVIVTAGAITFRP